ncbi:MAG TPA: hypothetical protein VIC05_00265 [Solirubrobacteraceae bacterium]|jgi:F0F1-type ATP synthase membrane subunit c/vacuolar-type H+-ATPase subunit K
MRKVFEIGGLVAAVVLVAFGVAAIVVSVSGRDEVQTALKQQKVAGTPDMSPAAIRAEVSKAGLNPSKLELPTCTAANKSVNSGSTARCFANYMRIHALVASHGAVYSQMPRFASPTGAGTNNEAEALKSNGKALENPARNVWVTETALSTALNASYMGEQLSLFGIMVGLALLLSGIGFAVLTFAGALRNPETALGFVHKMHWGRHRPQAAGAH